MHAEHALPVLLPPLPEQRFDCHGCNHCCKNLVVHLTAEDRDRIDAQRWEHRLPHAPYVRLDGRWTLNQMPDGGCVFLKSDGKCSMHAEHGFESKPIACRLYPFTLVPQEGGLQVGFRFDCPSLAASKGAALSEHVSGLTQMAPQLPHAGVRSPAIMLTKGRPASELELHTLIQTVDAWITDDARLLLVRLQGLVGLVHTLSALNLHSVRDGRFTELVELLAAELGMVLSAEVALAPTPKQRKLFRHQVFAHSQWIRFAEARGGFRAKFAKMLSQLGGHRRFGRLDGVAPATVLCERELHFSDIEAVSPADSESQQVSALVVRYIRAQLLTRGFCGSAYYGWDALLGLRALAARIAVWGFWARYCAAAEGNSRVDYSAALRAIAVIAQTAGISKALGSRTERLRLTYLGLDHGLERLLGAYTLV